MSNMTNINTNCSKGPNWKRLSRNLRVCFALYNVVAILVDGDGESRARLLLLKGLEVRLSRETLSVSPDPAYLRGEPLLENDIVLRVDRVLSGLWPKDKGGRMIPS